MSQMKSLPNKTRAIKKGKSRNDVASFALFTSCFTETLVVPEPFGRAFAIADIIAVFDWVTKPFTDNLVASIGP